MRLPDSDLSDLPTLLFGTVDGALGMLVSLPPPLYEMLARLQVGGGVGGEGGAGVFSMVVEVYGEETQSMTVELMRLLSDGTSIWYPCAYCGRVALEPFGSGGR
jgi:hypothetical protein